MSTRRQRSTGSSAGIQNLALASPASRLLLRRAAIIMRVDWAWDARFALRDTSSMAHGATGADDGTGGDGAAP